MTPRLSEYARSFVFPRGIVKTVWPRVEAKGRELGLGFDWWQSQLGTVCLGYGHDGKYVATVGGIGFSIPRQVGKTYFVMVVLIILCILFPGLQVVWTSHHLRTTTKTLTTIRGLARRKKIAPHIRTVRTSHGEGQVEFVNGSMMMFGARSQGFGRGFDEIDVEVFDEAQILDTKALEDMIAATNQARHEHGALLFFMGTPPRPSDPSEAFARRRSDARSGEATDAVWLEIGADPESDSDDWTRYPLMNPSFPTRTPLESLLRLRTNLGDDDSWNREGRGIWDPIGSNQVIPAQSWADAGDETSVPTGRLSLGVEVGPDMAWASVVLAGQRSDEDWHLELDERRDGTAWLAPYLAALLGANPAVRAVMVDVGGPIATMLERRGARWFFKDSRVQVTPVTVAGLGAGCSLLLNGIVTGSVHHTRQPQMDAAVKIAGKRRLGDTGLWVFSRSSTHADITPVLGAVLALIGAQAGNVKKPTREGGGRRVGTF